MPPGREYSASPPGPGANLWQVAQRTECEHIAAKYRSPIQTNIAVETSETYSVSCHFVYKNLASMAVFRKSAN